MSHKSKDSPGQPGRGQEAADGHAASNSERANEFSTLYAAVAPALYAWAVLHVKAPLRAMIDPEDVLQEVACRAYERFNSFDPTCGSFREWLFGFARNVLYHALERLRSARVHEPIALQALPDTAKSVTSRVAHDANLASFVQWAEAMPEEDRRLLLYRGLEGLPHEQVARLMHLSPEAVMQRWSRLRLRLRESQFLSEFVAA